MAKRFHDNIARVRVHKTPLLFSTKSLYRLSDFSYGEWLIYEDGAPKYYLNIFDDQYSPIRDALNTDVENFLIDRFKKSRPKLSLKQSVFGIPLQSRSEIVELDLQTLPVTYLT